MRKFVRTPPIVDRDRRLARKAVLQYADVGGRAADVDHRAVFEARRGAPRRASSSSAPRRTSRPGSARRSRRSSACRRSGSGRPAPRSRAPRARSGTRPRCASASSRRHAFMIVAFSRSSRPIRPISCERLIDSARQLLAENRCGLFLELGVHRREHRRDGDRADACVRGCPPPRAAARRGRAARSRGRRTRGRRGRGRRAPPIALRSRGGQSTSGGSARGRRQAEPHHRRRHEPLAPRRRRS